MPNKIKDAFTKKDIDLFSNAMDANTPGLTEWCKERIWNALRTELGKEEKKLEQEETYSGC